MIQMSVNEKLKKTMAYATLDNYTVIKKNEEDV